MSGRLKTTDRSQVTNGKSAVVVDSAEVTTDLGRSMEEAPRVQVWDKRVTRRYFFNRLSTGGRYVLPKTQFTTLRIALCCSMFRRIPSLVSPHAAVLFSTYILSTCFLSACAGEDASGTPGSGSVEPVPELSAELPPEPENPDTLQAREVFAPEQVLEYRIRMPDSVAEELEREGNREEYVPAELTITGGYFGTVEFAEVGFRHKGAWSLHHCWDDFDGERSFLDECERISYKVKFDKFDDDARLFGLKRLNLHAGRSDPSLLKELLVYSTFNAFGVDAPRAAPAKVYINDELVGMFVAVEAIDGRYTAFRNGESGDGNLYKEVWPKPDLEDGHYERALRTNDNAGGALLGFPNGVPDVSDIQAFARAVEASSAETFEEDMADWVSVETLLRYMAVDRAVKNWDGVMSFYSPLTSHNFYWYRDNAPGSLFELIPWDMDNTFWDADPYTNPVGFGLATEPVPDWNVSPASCEPISVWDINSNVRLTPPGCDKFLRLLASTQWETFRAIGIELLDGPLAQEVVKQKLDAWSELMRPGVRESSTQFSRWTWGTMEAREQVPQANGDFFEYIQQDYQDERNVAGAGEEVAGDTSPE